MVWLDLSPVAKKAVRVYGFVDGLWDDMVVFGLLLERCGIPVQGFVFRVVLKDLLLSWQCSPAIFKLPGLSLTSRCRDLGKK